jgi:hypothetical protein
MAIWERFKQTIFARLVSPEGQIVRDAKAALRDENQVAAAQSQSVDAESKRRADLLQTYVAKAVALEKDEAFRLLHTLTELGIAAVQQVKQIRHMEEILERHKSRFDPQTLATVRENLAADRAAIRKLVESVFQEETSFASARVSLQRLLARDSLAKQHLYEALQARKAAGDAARMTARLGRSLESSTDARKLKEQLQMENLRLQEEFRKLNFLLTSTITMLREDEHDLADKQKKFESLLESGFPKRIGEPLLQQIRQALAALNNKLQNEIAKTRLDLAEVER